MERRALTPENPDEIRSAIANLRAEHEELEARLGEFESRRWLSAEEQVERKQYQKRKLYNKDRIQQLNRLLES